MCIRYLLEELGKLFLNAKYQGGLGVNNGKTFFSHICISQNENDCTTISWSQHETPDHGDQTECVPF